MLPISEATDLNNYLGKANEAELIRDYEKVFNCYGSSFKPDIQPVSSFEVECQPGSILN